MTTASSAYESTKFGYKTTSTAAKKYEVFGVKRADFEDALAEALEEVAIVELDTDNDDPDFPRGKWALDSDHYDVTLYMGDDEVVPRFGIITYYTQRFDIDMTFHLVNYDEKTGDASYRLEGE